MDLITRRRHWQLEQKKIYTFLVNGGLAPGSGTPWKGAPAPLPRTTRATPTGSRPQGRPRAPSGYHPRSRSLEPVSVTFRSLYLPVQNASKTHWTDPRTLEDRARPIRASTLSPLSQRTPSNRGDDRPELRARAIGSIPVLVLLVRSQCSRRSALPCPRRQDRV